MAQFRTHRKGFVSTIFVLCLLSPLVAWAGVAGKVIFKSGVASVKHADNSTEEAKKDLSLVAGDTIETQEGRVQLSLIDGGKVSLQPNTIYKINKYEFSGKEDGSEYAFTELIKGGLRTITGWVGHKNPERYQLKTAVATIGIRGTEFTLNLNGDRFLMTTNQGSVDVCNGAGCLNASAGMSVAVNGAGDKPKFSKAQATSRANQPNANSTVVVALSKPVFATADMVGGNGLPDVINDNAENVINNPSQAPSNPSQAPSNPSQAPSNPSQAPSNPSQAPSNPSQAPSNPSQAPSNPSTNPLANFSGGDAMVTTLMKTGCACGIDDVYEARLKMNVASQSVQIDNGRVPTTISLLTFDALNSGSDGVVSWGRATGSFRNGSADEAIEWTDYIVGLKPIPGQLNKLSGTYHVFASTAPMLVNGVGSTQIGAVGSTTGSLQFNFGTGSYNYSLNVQAAGETYQLVGSGAKPLDRNNPSFAATGTVTSTGATCASGGCTQALHNSANLIQGAFFGRNGERAGLQYGFSAPSGAIYGGAVLK